MSRAQPRIEPAPPPRPGFRRRREGSVLVEGAVVLLPAMTLILGLMEFAILFVVGASLNFAAAQVNSAARSGPLASPPATLGDMRETAAEVILGFARDCIEVQGQEFVDLADFGTGGDGTALAEADALGSQGDVGAFQISCSWAFLTPLIADVAGEVAVQTRTVVHYEQP